MPAEFQVNSYEENWQRDPDILALPDGGFWVVWESYFNNYDDGPTLTYVAGQRYDANGARVGGEVIFDAVNDARSADVRITALSDGGFALVWTYDGYDDILTLRTEIYAQTFDADGTARQAAFRVDTVDANDAVLPEAIALQGGGFIVQWGVTRSTTLFDQIYSQQYTAAGEAVGVNTLVNSNVGEFDQIYVRSAALSNGTTISIWNSEGSFPVPGSTLDSNEIRGTIYRADGSVLRNDFSLTENIGTVGLHPGNGYDVAALAGGGFVISQLAYDFDLDLDTPDTSYYMVMRFFDAAGNQSGGPNIVFASDDLSNGTRITQLETGQILVVWSQDPLQDQISDDVYGRLLTAHGVALTGVFEVSNDYGDSFAEQVAPEITALAGGGFAITYMSESIDSDHEGVAARIYGRGTTADDILSVDQSGTMAGLEGNDVLTGNTGHNGLYGGAGNDALDAGSGRDTLWGGAGNDSLTGGASNDILQGGSGNDVLYGGLGRDRMAGGTGSDSFVFAETPVGANQDVITDFTSADSILLDLAVFAAAGVEGLLARHAFKVLGTASIDSSDRVLYDRATGAVLYDADGSGAGAARLIVTLETPVDLTRADFVLI